MDNVAEDIPPVNFTNVVPVRILTDAVELRMISQ